MPLSDTLLPLFRSKTLGQVLNSAMVMGVYSLIPVFKELTSYKDVGDLPPQIHAALTLFLGWLLVFRTNSAYARWWEARTLWGSLVNSSRNLACKLFHLVRLPETTRAPLRDMIIQFPKCLRDHLRRPTDGRGGEVISGNQGDAHIPAAIVTSLYDEIGRLKRNEVIDGNELRIIDVEMANYLNVCGACERILNTRITRAYRVFARQSIALYLITLPWGIVDSYHWWTVPMTIIVSYFMLGLEVVAEEIEEPFGYDEGDLNLDAMCESIERSVLQIASTRDAMQTT